MPELLGTNSLPSMNMEFSRLVTADSGELEGGGFILLETGDKLLTENSNNFITE